MRNCIADRDCLVAASFEYCDSLSTDGSQTGCGGNINNTQNTGDDQKLRIKLHLDTRYLIYTSFRHIIKFIFRFKMIENKF